MTLVKKPKRSRVPAMLRPHFEAAVARACADAKAVARADLARDVLDRIERAFEDCGLGEIPWSRVRRTVRSDPTWGELRAKDVAELRDDAADSRRLDETGYARTLSGAMSRDRSPLTPARMLELVFDVLECEWDEVGVVVPQSVREQLETDADVAIQAITEGGISMDAGAERLLAALAHPDLDERLASRRVKLLRVTTKCLRDGSWNGRTSVAELAELRARQRRPFTVTDQMQAVLKRGGKVLTGGLHGESYVLAILHACQVRVVSDELFRSLTGSAAAAAAAAPPTPYARDQRYARGVVLDHPTFGRGTVVEIADDRITVAFADATRVLRQARSRA